MVGEGGEAHHGIVLDLLLQAKEAEGRALGLPKASGPPNQLKNKADPNVNRTRKLAAVVTPTATRPKVPAPGSRKRLGIKAPPPFYYLGPTDLGEGSECEDEEGTTKAHYLMIDQTQT
eukprot:708375-Pyramimonas_sp.AAC.1